MPKRHWVLVLAAAGACGGGASAGQAPRSGPDSQQAIAIIGITVVHRWLIPGLIDAHVHFFQSGNLPRRAGLRSGGAHGRGALDAVRR